MTRSSNIETAKHIDFSKSVSDKTILVYTAHGYSKIQDKNHIYTADIRNIMGACHYLVWEVRVSD